MESSQMGNLYLKAELDELKTKHVALASKYIKLGTWTLLYRDKHEFLSDSYENNLRKKYGFDFTELKQNELIERDPFLGSHYTFGAEFKNHGWLTSPSLYIKELANHFKNNGGKIIKKQTLI